MIRYSGSPIIETSRLILRKLDQSDTLSVFNNWRSDERISRNRISPPHKTTGDTRIWLNHIFSQYDRKEFCYWGIELKSTGELIGEIDLDHFDTSTGNCEVSYSIGYQWWNQGYGTEALRAVVEFGFRYMNIHKISAKHNTDNPASGKVMRKAGMEQEGTVRHMILNYKNQYKDCAIYGLLQQDYQNDNNGEIYILKLNRFSE
ncbi:ribosomal-protein-alanine N-acetyltransferase [Gracilibacillus ureilyticus]|uniref:Ribosomal-protein-alanine N-acetyltransferase n=1 Tax=Gracilibacillus ureilyticus TaxID=531814 RepID=A0A1H9V944_9BACI|nr:GNAT family N-acetyltransferase [Gracilibacillus ureilyticus]SES18222.1 ribosomal-protein-alanine N-acetyltransferase [Gracilibacillus ureilyticus]